MNHHHQRNDNRKCHPTPTHEEVMSIVRRTAYPYTRRAKTQAEYEDIISQGTVIAYAALEDWDPTRAQFITLVWPRLRSGLRWFHRTQALQGVTNLPEGSTESVCESDAGWQEAWDTTLVDGDLDRADLLLAQFPEGDRPVLYLRGVLELEMDDVARALGVKRSTAAMRWSAAQKRARKILLTPTRAHGYKLLMQTKKGV